LLLEIGEQPRLVRLSPAGRVAAARLVNDLRASIDLAQERPAGEVLYDHLRRSGRLKALVAADSAEAVAEARNTALLFDLVRSRSRLLTEDRVAFLVPYLADALDAGDDPAGDGTEDEVEAVSVLTVHRAKGLEFGTVFVAGLSEGRFPSRGRREALPLPDELRRDRRLVPDEAPHAEERRLCYVALTRARDELILTWSAETGTGRRRRPSPFVAEALGAEPAIPARRDAGLPPQPGLAPVAAPVPARNPRSRREPLELSFSQLDDYLTCPRRYELRHVRGVPVPAHHALGYGTALHAAAAALNQRRAKGDAMPLEDVLEVYRTHWSNEGFLSREHEEARYAAGEAALRRLHASESASPDVASAVEERFSFNVNGVRIRGRFDRVDGSGAQAVITDYKSGDVRDPEQARERARDSLQLQIYALAHEARSGSLPAATQLHFLDSGVIGRAAVEPRRLERARTSIGRAADGIRNEAFAATPDAVACAMCPFRRICPDSAA
jgi:DNA helicase-2/ATP-dependent DNA helicase PcrA